MGNVNENISGSSSHIDHIPLIWIAPDKQQQSTRLAIWLPGGMGKKEDTLPRLQQLARAGFVAISFDPWQHGERGTGKSVEQMFTLAMADFPNTVWPILGQSALDTLRVIDWAIAEFDSSPPCYIGGESLGGDIAVAAAGIDSRISCVSAIIATPDWRRPGMHAWGQLVQSGLAGGYAQFFYDHINPPTNLSGYAHCPAIAFECGAEDDHVPPRWRPAVPDGTPANLPIATRPVAGQSPSGCRTSSHSSNVAKQLGVVLGTLRNRLSNNSKLTRDAR